MPEPTGVARSPSPEERRYRRFNLRYPVHLLFHAGDLISEVDGVSRDVSVGGLLVESPVLMWRVPDRVTGGGSWVGVAPDGSLLLTRDTGTQEIYALNIKWP